MEDDIRIPKQDIPVIVVIISANNEWQVIKDIFNHANLYFSPFGEIFDNELDINGVTQTVTFIHGGWGKIAAASSTQFVIDQFSPDLLINLGTCGGFEGQIDRGQVILVDKTIVYDIHDQMLDPEDSLAHYTTNLDLSWLPEFDFPQDVVKTLLISADKDLIPGEIEHLKERFGAIAGDWESGAIAYVSTRNRTKCLILRGVSDLVSSTGGEAYNDFNIFVRSTRDIIERLVNTLPEWIALL
jgi:adenosylhomocysteine nucleosidase